MNAMVWVGLLLAVFVFFYLLAFLLYPERFS